MITDDPHCPFFYKLLIDGLTLETRNDKDDYQKYKKRLQELLDQGIIGCDQFSGEYFFDPDWDAECRKRLEFLDL